MRWRVASAAAAKWTPQASALLCRGSAQLRPARPSSGPRAALAPPSARSSSAFRAVAGSACWPIPRQLCSGRPTTPMRWPTEAANQSSQTCRLSALPAMRRSPRMRPGSGPRSGELPGCWGSGSLCPGPEAARTLPAQQRTRTWRRVRTRPKLRQWLRSRGWRRPTDVPGKRKSLAPLQGGGGPGSGGGLARLLEATLTMAWPRICPPRTTPKLLRRSSCMAKPGLI
mmetsp:Transcript_86335/g.270138  ORF Transcript_86335/g.270138 Transcript_86335/m.270138 type:complete len:227 (-) Transcript_86335:470-1150(-)